MANSKKIGDKFQEDFSLSIPEELYWERYKDSPTMYKKVHNTGDYWINDGRFVFIAECKTTKETKRIPLNNFQREQIWKMLIACTKYKTQGGFIINFREIEQTYFIFLSDFIYWFLELKKFESGSIPIDYIIQHGYKLSKQKRITRYRYGIQGLLNWIYSQKEMNDIGNDPI